jgi:hypothetical protein
MNRWFATAAAAILLFSSTIAIAHARPAWIAPRTNCQPAPNGFGLLTDGDFSEAPDPGGIQGIPVGTRFAPDWIVTLRTIDFYGRTGAWPVPGGLCSVDLDGSGPQGVGAIAHAPMMLDVHHPYTLSFLFSGNTNCAPFQHGPSVKTLLVEVAGQHRTQGRIFYWETAHHHDANHGIFKEVSWSFHALELWNQVVFESLDRPINSNCGPVIAGMSLVEN